MGTADMDSDDKLPRSTDIVAPRPAAERRSIRPVHVVVGLLVALLAIGGVSFAFRRASDDLAAIHRDTAASVNRVNALSEQLAHATTERDRSLHEAALARAAYEQARDAHERGADALHAELADLDSARRQAYASLLDANARDAQLTALHSCLDGVWQALDMLGVGDVNGWKQRMQGVTGVCAQAQGAAA